MGWLGKIGMTVVRSTQSRSVGPIGAVHDRARSLKDAQHGRAPKALPPMLHVHDQVCQATSPLSSSARLVALLIAKRMAPGADGRDVAFMGEQDLADRSGLSVRTVRRAMGDIHDSGLFDISLGGVTRGRFHRCRSFALVR